MKKIFDVIEYANKFYSLPEDIEDVLNGEHGNKMRNSLLKIKNDKEFWKWLNKNYEF